MLDYTQTSLHFQILEEIGQEGKNSTVYIAHDNQLDTKIVVKKINKSDFKEDSLFFGEAKKLYSSSHPNIVPIQYSCQDDANIYITMPWFQKGSLNSIIDEKFLTVTEIVKYSIDFLSGLHHIHSKGLVHCDIKPTNILVSDSNDAILTDFGLALYLNKEGLASIDKFYHSHIAPETIQSNKTSYHSDIFQAGLTVYRLCNGNVFFKKQLDRFVNKERVFDNDKFFNAISEGKFPDRSDYLCHIPQTLRKCIERALKPNPKDRYQNVLDFLNGLARIEIFYNWKMELSENGCTWKCVKDDKVYNISIIGKDDKKAELKTTKKGLSRAKEKERRISNYCVKSTTFDEAYSLAKKALLCKNLN